MARENEKSYEPSDLESSDREGALSAAATYLCGSIRRDEACEGIDEWELSTHQWNLLSHWAKPRALIVPTNLAPEEQGGREHDVRFDDDRGRWLKFTKASSAGYMVEMAGDQPMLLPASPLQYLDRWILHNRLFSDDVEFMGVRSEGHVHQLVISQKDWGADFPSWEELERAMLDEYQLSRLHLKESLGGYEARAYMRGQIAIFDVRPDNCARAATGLIIPYDVIPCEFDSNDAMRLRKFL